MTERIDSTGEGRIQDAWNTEFEDDAAPEFGADFARYSPKVFDCIPLHKPKATREIERKGESVLIKVGKRPLHPNWTTTKYDAKEVVKQCQRERRNMGIRPRDGQMLIDIDPRNGGDEGFAELCLMVGEDFESFPTVRTGSGGRHVYMTIPKGMKVSDTIEGFPGVEFKGPGRQLLAAGSQHPDTGKPYVFEGRADINKLPPAPAGLLELIKRPERPKSANPGGHIANHRLAVALEGLNPEKFRDHDEWLQLMMACHHATGGEGRQEFIEWSTQDPEFADMAEDIGRRWDSLHANRDDGVTVASLNRQLVKAKRNDLLLPVKSATKELVGDIPYSDDAEDADGEGEPDEDDNESDGALTVTSAADIEPKSIQWLWRKRIPVGKLTIIAGFPEAGKSQVSTSLAAAVSNGDTWPNGEGKATQGAVFLLSSEDDPDDTIIPRLKAAGANMDSVFVVGSIIRTKGKGARVFNLADDLSRLSDAIKAQRDRGQTVRLVIIDPISAYVGSGNKGDSHKNTEMRALLTPLKEWAAKHKVAVVAISHFNKGGNSHAVYRVTDSLAFTAAARMVWFCVILEDGQRVMIRGKGNISEDVGGLSYEIEGKTIKDSKGREISTSRVVWGDPVDVTADDALSPKKGRPPSAAVEATDWLEDFLKDGPQPSKVVKAAADDNGFSDYALRRAREALGVDPKRDGFQGDYMWRLPADPDETEFG